MPLEEWHSILTVRLSEGRTQSGIVHIPTQGKCVGDHLGHLDLVDYAQLDVGMHNSFFCENTEDY